MMDSLNTETSITLSSDTAESPERTKSKNIQSTSDHQCKTTNSVKKDKDKLIVISDSELEEGEIEDEDEVEGVNTIPVISSEVTLESSEPEREFVDHKLDYQTTPRVEEFENVEEIQFESVEGNTVDEEFPWSELRVLLVGDERVVALNWEEWSDFPEQELYHLPNCDLNAMCSLAEKHLYKEYDVVFLIGFHYDFIQFNDEVQADKLLKLHSNSPIDLKSNINIDEMIKTVQKFHYKWLRQYPNTNIIWTIPSPPDFLKYNSIVLQENGVNPDKKLNKNVQYSLTKDYFALTRKLAKEWKGRLKYVPLFPLNKVLFMKRSCYKRSFLGGGIPKFPRGFLRDGLYPTKMMAICCAYLLVEYLMEQGFYPENKTGLDFTEAEARLVRMDPDMKSYIHANERYSRKGSSSRHGHSHSYDRRYENSLSPHNSPHEYRSRSRSRKRRIEGQSTSTHRHRSRSRERHRSRSRSRNKGRTRSRCQSRSSSRTRLKRKSHHESKLKQRKSRTNSMSVSPVSSVTPSPDRKKNTVEISTLNKDEKVRPEEVKRTNIKDEVNFWKTLRYLREIHDLHCTKFRSKPHTHPQYKAEKRKFFKDLRQPRGDDDLSKWDKHWRLRLEEILEESWADKKNRLTIDLNQKATFTSLNSFANEGKNKGEVQTQNNERLDERSKFKEENVETINSYLNELDSTGESSESRNKSDAAVSQMNDLGNFAQTSTIKESTVRQGDPDTNHRQSSESLNPLKMVSTSSREVNLPPSFDPKSGDDEDGSSQSSDSDLDVDGLMENPDFLQGLEEIDRELQNAVPSEDKMEISDQEELHPYPNNDRDIFKPESKVTETVCSQDEMKIEFVNVLKMLFRISKRLGPLGLSVSALYHRASDDLRNRKDTFPTLNSDSKSLLSLVDKKLNFLLNDNLPQLQKAIYGEIRERLQSLLGKIHVEHDRFSKVNIHSIAMATLSQEVSEVVSFIKNTLLYHGYTQFTSDDVMNIYMSVKASQLDMEKS